MSSRRARDTAKGEAELASQLEEYAFNTFGWAIKIPTDKAEVAMATTTINAYIPSTKPWATAIAKIEKDGENPWRESLSFTPRESAHSEEAGIQ